MNVHSEKILDGATKISFSRLYHQKEIMKYFKGYVRHSKAWYGYTLNGKIEVTIGMYSDDGSREFSMRWIDLGGVLCAKLECFEDSWATLNKFKPLLKKLAEVEKKGIQEDEFCQILDSLGYKDLTEYEKK